MSTLKSIYKPSELSAMVKLKLGAKRQKNGSEIGQMASEDIAFCYNTLDRVSRSFAMVIRELPEPLSLNVCLFYLILRGLDSIEDDMELPNNEKVDLLRNFYQKNYKSGWNIKGVGDKEEYRELLKNYDKVIGAFSKLDESAQAIITDICKKMGNGMADFAGVEIITVADYDLYCHHVAGLVGIGLSGIFSSSFLEDNGLRYEEELSNTMGLFLQKINIVRDYREDLDAGRTFWPKEIWNKYADDLDQFAKEPNADSSLSCLNHMVNNALAHVVDCLDYMKRLKDPQVFRFCAIPQVMAIATLKEVYNNSKVFEKNVKIRKGFAAKLIVNTNTMCDVVNTYDQMVQEMLVTMPKQGMQSAETRKSLLTIKAYCQNELVGVKKVS